MITFNICLLHLVFMPRNVNLFIGPVCAGAIIKDGGDTEVQW